MSLDPNQTLENRKQAAALVINLPALKLTFVAEYAELLPATESQR